MTTMVPNLQYSKIFQECGISIDAAQAFPVFKTHKDAGDVLRDGHA